MWVHLPLDVGTPRCFETSSRTDLSSEIHFRDSILAPFWALEAGREVLEATLGQGPRKPQKNHFFRVRLGILFRSIFYEILLWFSCMCFDSSWDVCFVISVQFWSHFGDLLMVCLWLFRGRWNSWKSMPLYSENLLFEVWGGPCSHLFVNFSGPRFQTSFVIVFYRFVVSLNLHLAAKVTSQSVFFPSLLTCIFKHVCLSKNRLEPGIPSAPEATSKRWGGNMEEESWRRNPP